MFQPPLLSAREQEPQAQIFEMDNKEAVSPQKWLRGMRSYHLAQDALCQSRFDSLELELSLLDTGHQVLQTELCSEKQ